MFEGQNKNVITYEAMSMDQQKYKYDKDSRQITNTATGLVIAVENQKNGKQVRIGKNIIAEKSDTDNWAQRFQI